MSSTFVCSQCGHSAHRWFGRCPECDSWSTGKAAPVSGDTSLDVSAIACGGDLEARLPTGSHELDRVLGGGLVPGAVALVSGEPGVGKSTLILQLMDGLSRRGTASLLISGEESAGQVAMRAARLGVDSSSIAMAVGTSLPSILATADLERCDVLIVDSIQTLRDPQLDQSAGSVTQVRECAARLVEHAKSTGRVVVLVGHVTKDGSVAGPKTLEHIVDVILSLEGERGGPLRILRALKNRFGSCEEAALFSMEATGLRAIEDPSAMLLSDRARGAPGSVVFPALEGTRPMLVEIQALVTKSSLAQPRRVAIGVDPRRLSMLIGVMTKHKALDDAAADVFVAAAGGFHVKDPASDLAIALTLSSSARGIPILEDTIAIGEIGLAGELRRVSGLDRRLAEAARLGFRTAIVPRGAPRSSESLRNVEVADLRSAIDAAFAGVVA